MSKDNKAGNNTCKSNLHLFRNISVTSGIKFASRSHTQRVSHTLNKMWMENDEKNKQLKAEAKKYRKKMEQQIVNGKLGRHDALFYLDY
ncbi:MAG: hypothetical protein JW864_16695 [Spirochaetes bacterium]|nr:hypothetical protein [Spirochaetota bacterium]